MLETIFYWVFLITCIFAFFFSYGIVEDLIRKWSRGLHTRGKQTLTPVTIDKSPDPWGNGHGDYVLH